MTLAQTERLLKLLRANGVEYFKHDEIEIRLKAVESPTEPHVVGPELPQVTAPVVPRGTQTEAVKPEHRAKSKRRQGNAGDVVPAQANIPHHVNEIISVMNMTPEQLLDVVFPEGAEKPPQLEQAGA